MAGRFEEAVAGPQQALQLAFGLEHETARGHDPDGRYWMAVISRGLAGCEADARALDELHRGIGRRQRLIEHRLAFECRETSVIQFGPSSFRKSAISPRVLLRLAIKRD